MSQVITGRAQGESARRTYLEVLRTDDTAVLAALDGDCSVTLLSHPLQWFEIDERFKNGRGEFSFDQVFRPLLKGGQPYPVAEAARKLIRGAWSAPTGFKNGALSALVDVLPSGDIHLFTQEDGFVGRFAEAGDALMVARALGRRPVLVGSEDDVKELPAVDLGIVLTALDPERSWPAKLQRKHYQEVFEMAKKKVKTKAKKVVKAEAAQRRADGPVAKARELFRKMKDKTTEEILKACDDAGINRNTAQTQLGRWRKENGITVKRGGKRKADATKPKEPSAATAKKEKGGKKAKKKREPAAPRTPAPTGTPVPPKDEDKPEGDKAAATTEHHQDQGGEDTSAGKAE